MTVRAQFAQLGAILQILLRQTVLFALLDDICTPRYRMDTQIVVRPSNLEKQITSYAISIFVIVAMTQKDKLAASVPPQQQMLVCGALPGGML